MINSFHDPELRLATSADLPGIIKLVKLILKEFDQPYDENGSERDLTEFKNYFTKDRCLFYVLLYDQTVIGSIGLLSITEYEARIKKMYIARYFRGLGLATALMDKVLQQAALFGYKKISLETMTTMESAIHLYRKYGFMEVVKEVQSRRCDIVMEKIL